MIAVTGSRGWVGGAVYNWLVNSGHAARSLARDRQVGIDLLDPDWRKNWIRPLSEVEALVHCAAYVHRPIETSRDQSLFHAINVEGTRRLVAVAREVGVKRVVLASTIAVYDWSKADGPRNELAPIGPQSSYGKSKLAAERVVQSGFPTFAIARLATVFGGGDTANFKRLAMAMRHRRFVLPSGLFTRKSVLSIAMAGEALAKLALDTRDPNVVLNLAITRTPSLREICRGFEVVCGFPPPREMPYRLLQTLAYVGDVGNSLGLRSPFSNSTLSKLTTSTEVDVSAFNQRFPEFESRSFEDELLACRSYYGAQGLL